MNLRTTYADVDEAKHKIRKSGKVKQTIKEK